LVAAVGVVLVALVMSAVPVFGHASFPASSVFGFAPNTSGGTGAAGSTPPYAAGSTQTLYLRAPFEQTDPFPNPPSPPDEPNPDTTVRVDAIVPAGWTNPVCGPAKRNLNDASTNNTNQPGADVSGWTCQVVTVGSHQVLRWTGPQIEFPGTAADSAQFFVFSVTVPSPAVQTSYSGAAGTGTEGFIVDQYYASGFVSHWIPNADFPGTAPEGSETEVATGLVRTVAAVVPEPEPAPVPEPVVVSPTFTG
jgi:hypothetical protein